VTLVCLERYQNASHGKVTVKRRYMEEQSRYLAALLVRLGSGTGTRWLLERKPWTVGKIGRTICKPITVRRTFEQSLATAEHRYSRQRTAQFR
jgi:hypothetical protein